MNKQQTKPLPNELICMFPKSQPNWADCILFSHGCWILMNPYALRSRVWTRNAHTQTPSVTRHVPHTQAAFVPAPVNHSNFRLKRGYQTGSCLGLTPYFCSASRSWPLTPALWTAASLYRHLFIQRSLKKGDPNHLIKPHIMISSSFELKGILIIKSFALIAFTHSISQR